MQVMSKQEYRLKLKRLISNMVSCLVTYSNRYFFIIQQQQYFRKLPNPNIFTALLSEDFFSFTSGGG